MKAHTTEGESEAMQIGRDDYKAFKAIRKSPWLQEPGAPFPQGSEDAAQWEEGWTKERDGK